MLIILDRDGVINHDSEHYIRTPHDWYPIPGSLAAIAALNAAGHKVVVATNQSGVGRGYFTEEILAKIHKKMLRLLAKEGGHLDGIYYCPHTPENHCACRKPKPGMLWQIRDDYPALFPTAIFVGDSIRDLEAAYAAPCRAVWIQAPHRAEVHLPEEYCRVPSYPDLQSFVREFLR